MSYTIYKSDSTYLTTVLDGQIEQTTTNLTFIGKNSSNYGNYFNENFTYLLENFASSVAPNHPIAGQCWYDTNTGRLKVYDGNIFKVTGGALVSSTAPAQLAAGDIWIDSANQQMYFNDGSETILAAPIYTKNQGVSGFKTYTILDVYSNPHTVLYFYLAGSLVGIHSLDTFTPLNPISGYTNGQFTGSQSGTTLTITSVTTGQISIGQILTGTGLASNTVVTSFKTGTGGVGTYTVSTSASVTSTTINATNKVVRAGFNVSSYPGLLFNMTVSSANSLLASDGTVKSVSDFMSSGDDTGTTNTSNSVSITNDNALQLGSQQSSKIYSGTDAFKIQSTAQGAVFQVNVLPTGGTTTTALYVNTNVSQIGVYTVNPQATLDVNGSVVVRGNLDIKGTSITIETNLAPANSTAPGTPGQIQWDSSYLYICTASNNWKRVPLNAF